MFDLIKRILVTLISGAMILYTGTLISSQAVIVQPEYSGMNFVSLMTMIVIAGYMMIVYGIYPLYHPMQKRILAIVGIASILFGHVVLLNDYNTSMYAGDIMKIFGVMIVWFGATGLLTSTKITEQKK
jgi:hypothetical protein